MRDIPAPNHLPRDHRKARIGWQRVNPEASSCTPFWTADVLNPENNKTAPMEQIGYTVHAHCWILVDRVIGTALVEANLKIFVTAVERFWAENATLWCRSPFRYVGHETNSDPDPDIEPGDWPDDGTDDELEPIGVPAWENPAIVPRIQEIIEQATQNPDADSCPQQKLSHIPLDIAIQIVEFSKLASVADTRNMLVAFGWKLPDSYWKSRYCRMDLVFEYADLQKTNCPVDWQLIGLATEELMEDPNWERNTGLGTRRWIFRHLGQIKTIFQDLLERDKTKPGFLDHPRVRKYPLRKRLL